MPLSSHLWFSGHMKRAVSSVGALILEKQVYHIREYTTSDIARCRVLCNDGQEHWIDREHFAEDIAGFGFLNYIKQNLALATTTYVETSDEEAMKLMNRMYMLLRLLQTNSLVKHYDVDSVCFVYDSYYEPDKQQRERTMTWKSFEKFVANHVIQDKKIKAEVTV